MTKFCFRTSFAGCEVPKKVEKASMAISKKYKSLRSTGTSDKSVFFEMDDAEFKQMRAEHETAGLDYLIEVEGEDYNAY
jgi:hypothetical protein